MERLEIATALDRGIDAALRNDRRITISGLAAVVMLAWLYLWHSTAAMDHATLAMATMTRASDTGALALTFFMWTVMMVGMMLPGAAPAIMLYGTLVRKNGERGVVLPGVWIFTGAYLLVWAGFSAVATLLQTALEQTALLTPGMTTASASLGAAALIVAGLYQLTPFKQACLGKCRNPLEFFITRWRAGSSGAFRMGLEHGAYCVGCCWALMLVLFVAGVMNLLWVALLAAFVFVEKLFPAAPVLSRGAGAALILCGFFLLMSA